MLITLDGIDGGGKSTQVARLAEHLQRQGRTVLTVRDPGGTPTGEAIRGLLLDSQLTMNRRSEALLFMAARGELVQQRIRPALDQGQVVISDRFLLANVVYQSIGDRQQQAVGPASDRPGDSQTVAMPQGLDPDELWRVGLWATGGLRPDLTLLLDLPAEAAGKRFDRPADRMEARGLDYMTAVRQAFLTQLPRSSPQTAVIDASGSPEQVHRAIVAAVERAATA